MKLTKTSISLYMVAFCMFATNINAQSLNEPMVSTHYGDIQGVTYNNVDSFKGIPFAQPPIGDLRWKEPQPVKEWEGVLDASDFKSDCMQKPFPGDAAPLGKGLSEDCLYLNVWKPSKTSKPLPVVVWIYGGGFVNGGASPDIYSGHKFAEQDVIFVSFNYRVGRFGFFAHPQLSKEQPDGLLGNYGYMDQIAALRWVKENISAFGGDASRVTLMGESAGGFSVHTMLNSPKAKGLFQQAIIQSGGGRTELGSRLLRDTNSFGQSSAELVGVDFAQSMGIDKDDPEALSKLRKLDAEQIVNGLNMATMMDPTYSGPMIDGKVVVSNPQDYYSANQHLNIPLLVGTTDFEIGFPPPNVTTFEVALQAFGEDNFLKAKKAYTDTVGNDPMSVAQAVASDFLMVEPGRFVANKASEQPSPVYAYRFSYVVDSQKMQMPGAAHATDIPFAFNTLEVRYGDGLTDKDKAAAEVMNLYWVNFIKTGSPNAKSLPEWEKFSTQKQNLMDFSNNGTEAFQMMRDPWKARLDLVEAVASK